MRALCLAAMLVALLIRPLLADTRKIFKTTVEGHVTLSAEYIKGKNTRTENLDQSGAPLFVTISNFERRTVYQVDMRMREYIEHSPGRPDWIQSLALWMAHRQSPEKKVNIYYEITDTGERKQFFGYTAKHLVLKQRQVADRGFCGGSYQTEKDGWYIQPAENPPPHVYYALIADSLFGPFDFNVCRDRIVRHGNPPPPGIPVLENRGMGTLELVELSTASLDDSLFIPPKDFKRVDFFPGQQPMPWFQRMEFEWTQLGHAFESWLNLSNQAPGLP